MSALTEQKVQHGQNKTSRKQLGQGIRDNSRKRKHRVGRSEGDGKDKTAERRWMGWGRSLGPDCYDRHPGQHIQEGTVRTGQSGQDSQDRTVRTGQSGQDSQDRTVRTGQSGQDRQGRTDRAGQSQSGQDSQSRTDRAGQTGQDSQGRTVRAGQSGQDRQGTFERQLEKDTLERSPGIEAKGQ